MGPGESSMATPEPRSAAGAREATPEELRSWDEQAVVPPGGHVLQSRAWAEHRSRAGRRPRFLVTPDGGRVLALERPWPMMPGGRAYVSRGPAPIAPAEVVATRLSTVADWLAGHGVDVVAADAEVPAASPYGDLIRARGFRPIEEIQASRHTMRLPLGAGVDSAAVWSGLAKANRQRIRRAEATLSVVLRDRRAETHGDGASHAAVRSSPAVLPVGVEVDSANESIEIALTRFSDMLRETGERRGFAFAAEQAAVGWWVTAFEAGWLLYLEARAADEPIGGLTLYRHGGRLSTVASADRAARRTSYPGAMNLLRWRAIELAIAEHCAEMDLGGVDVAGARRRPVPGDPTYGLYEHKRSFGAEWVDLTGAHELVLSAGRYLVGRGVSRASRLVGGPG